jgi:hypothetical protein
LFARVGSIVDRVCRCLQAGNAPAHALRAVCGVIRADGTAGESSMSSMSWAGGWATDPSGVPPAVMMNLIRCRGRGTRFYVVVFVFDVLTFAGFIARLNRARNDFSRLSVML